MPVRTKSTKFITVAQLVLIALVSFVLLRHSPHVKAVGIIMVNSKADNAADDGQCTFREAIISANTNTVSGVTPGECAAGSGADTINFAITGTADFINATKNGYTITLTSGLPDINSQVTINGYSQPDSSPNDAIAPNPLNGVLLIELNGENVVGEDGLVFTAGSENSLVKGLVVNNFASQDAFKLLASTITIQGNYIGTNPQGTLARPNGVGVNGMTTEPTPGINALIGGLNAADRNLISGNTDGTTATAGYPASGTTIQGNYVGVAADGLTPIANSTNGGSGSFSVDDASNVLIGGSQSTAKNVIGASLGHGLAPDLSSDVTIENNYIGLGYDGTTVLGSISGGSGSGLSISNMNGIVIKNNRVAGWNSGGISVNPGNDNVTVQGNLVHNNAGNIGAFGSSNVTITDNIVFNSDSISNISVSGFSGFGLATDMVSVRGNNVGYLLDGSAAPQDDAIGIYVNGDPSQVTLGGTQAGQGNRVRGQGLAGIAITSLTVQAFEVTATPNVTILGNTVTGTSVSVLSPNSGLGIDLGEGIDTDESPDGAPNTFNEIGPTVNDANDADTGPNNYMNFPVLNNFTQNGNQASVNLDLDAADSLNGQYRIEFFANDAPDASGYGEGQTYLGYVDISNGAGQDVTFTLPSSSSLAGKSISATTTAIDNESASGYGSTSEFSQVVSPTVVTGGGSQQQGDSGSGAQNGDSIVYGETLPRVGMGIGSLILLVAGTLATATYIRRKRVLKKLS